MKKWNEALGYIDGAYLDEAMAASRRPRIRRGAIIAAVCAVMLTIGLAAVGIRYFAPGIGVVYDGSVRVLSATEVVHLGDIVLDTVMLTDHGDGTGTLGIWVYQAEQVNAVSSVSGERYTLDNMCCVINGVEYGFGTGVYGSIGFGSITFADVPVTDTVTLCMGDESVTVTLREGNPTNKVGTIHADTMTLSLFPASVTENVWAVELRDELMDALREDSGRNASVKVVFETVREDGGRGRLTNLDSTMKHNYICAHVGTDDYGIKIRKITRMGLSAVFRFRSDAPTPEVKITVPEKGETVPCEYVLYDSNGIICRVTEIVHDDNGVRFTTEAVNRTGREFERLEMTAAGYYVQDGVYTAIRTDNDGTYAYDYNSKTRIPLTGGEELVMKIGEIYIGISTDCEIIFH